MPQKNKQTCLFFYTIYGMRMNRFLSRVLLPVFLFFILAPVSAPPPRYESQAAAAHESGEYACILAENTYFYASADDRRGIFILPKTYYVRLIEYGTPYCKIEYLIDGDKTQRVVGYAHTDELTFVDFTPVNPYLTHVFDVHYRIDGGEIEDDAFLTQITVSCLYYGDFSVGSKTYCYVLRNGEFGYVPKPASLTYPENTEYQAYLDKLSAQSPPATTPSTPTEQAASPAQIAILIVLCLLVPILAALILKPPKRPPYELDD